MLQKSSLDYFQQFSFTKPISYSINRGIRIREEKLTYIAKSNISKKNVYFHLKYKNK